MSTPPSTIIENVEQLKTYLQVALQLEHATIPAYLTTAYTAKIDENKAAMDIIRAVAKEEMLHLTLAANLLNAIDGAPNLTGAGFVPDYPKPLPTGQSGFEIGLERLSYPAIEIFLDIERPERTSPGEENVMHFEKTVPIDGTHLAEAIREGDNPFIPVTNMGNGKYELHYKIGLIPHRQLSAERLVVAKSASLPTVMHTDDAGNPLELHFYSIGEFYKAISLGFVELSKPDKMGMEGLFSGDPGKQVAGKYYYSSGGELIPVTDLKTALSAIELIAGQGEGSHERIYDDENELAHYYRFDQIKRGQFYRVPDKDGNNGDEAGKPQGTKFPVNMDAVYPIKKNAKISDYDQFPELKENALLFNGQYKRFLTRLNAAFNGGPSLLGDVFPADMFRIKAAMDRLIRNPIPGTGENASPTFEMNHFKYPPCSPE